MNTDQFTTLGTSPFFLLAADERPYPLFFNHPDVINHAHPILGSVSLIQLFQSGAGEIAATAGTVLGFAFGELFAISDSTGGTVF